MEALGYGEEVAFPVYQERMPLQLLGYWRLARMQNSAELAMVGPCAATHQVLHKSEVRGCTRLGSEMQSPSWERAWCLTEPQSGMHQQHALGPG